MGVWLQRVIKVSLYLAFRSLIWQSLHGREHMVATLFRSVVNARFLLRGAMCGGVNVR